MYTVSVSRSFVAQHFLTVPDPGPEGELHSHHYSLEVTAGSPDLDAYGYVVDIDDLTAAVDDVTDEFRDRTLNDQSAFDGLNPSVEHFARVVADRLAADARIPSDRVRTLRVAMDEDDVARVSYERELAAGPI
ncbi:6-pyruvoyl trahydropterin synthase family protein [Natrarchaeobius oligotrophus]|uniref:6-carboxytetrahydropterin synthase n=1 Tax=Natrarchaeobius chitinivorans TaxID=1679083 RepID=A0A3N6MV34_NATCH|nr:6-carboxytetrahydropterin synthase [Natrarchaeobius chitinivorans]RQH01801.1 6-carboxytetrahydropterin synthase [Natrarchaeobius chitinivorans]